MSVGYGTGFSQAVDWGLEVAFKLVEQQKINITIDETMIKTGIMQYKDNIGGCLFLEDALVLYESWNQTRPG